MPKTILAANWKMNKTQAEAQNFIQELSKTAFKPDREVVLCPPFTALNALSGIKEVKLGAQNMHFEENGAFTGEISAAMLKELGCTYVLIGHSERRQLFGETDELINKKIIAAVNHGLIPVFCLGETLAQRESGETMQVITTQLKQGLTGINYINKLVIAYEPVWAIGTGKTATPQEAQEVHALIRSLTTADTSILYGGSVKPENISSLMAQPDINGALVGGASLKAEDFIKIINY